MFTLTNTTLHLQVAKTRVTAHYHPQCPLYCITNLHTLTYSNNNQNQLPLSYHFSLKVSNMVEFYQEINHKHRAIEESSLSPFPNMKMSRTRSFILIDNPHLLPQKEEYCKKITRDLILNQFIFQTKSQRKTYTRMVKGNEKCYSLYLRKNSSIHIKLTE